LYHVGLDGLFAVGKTTSYGPVKRSIKIEGTDIELPLSRATAVRTSKNMIHLDQLDDGSWRLIYNSEMIPDITLVKGFTIVREDG